MNGRAAKTQLIVRNLEEEVVRELKLQAARHGRSAEAEHRAILREALLPANEKKSIKEYLLSMPSGGDDADFERIPDLGREEEL
ncbi:MAG TPA: DNA-binding protein [Thermoanaerobaculia bacterium]|nr:DNA-binding protein [Thermoanaerobaculia bacterium]